MWIPLGEFCAIFDVLVVSYSLNGHATIAKILSVHENPSRNNPKGANSSFLSLALFSIEKCDEKTNSLIN
jgi:hypothetical protein